MKINMRELTQYLDGIADQDPQLRRQSVGGLAKISGAEWEGAPDAVTAAVGALVGPGPRRAAGRDGAFRAETAKVLGNIGTGSPAVVPELIRLLREDADDSVRAEAARALGKIGPGAASAGRALAAVLAGPGGGEELRGEAARALSRVAPQAPGTAAALRAAVDDPSGHVGVCAAESLWQIASEAGAVPALASRLGDPTARGAAAQALYRIGAKAKSAVPALLAVAKTKDRLFRELVVMAIRKIDPQAEAGIL